MNKLSTSWVAASAALVMGALVPGVASAQSTWDLISGAGCSQNATNTGNFGNSWACSGTGNAGTSTTAYAFSTQNGSAGTLQSINAATQYANAYMSQQGTSGFGVGNRTEGLNPPSPDHAIDNNPTGSYDMIVLNFGTAVILDQIGVGWTSLASGADVTIMRWTGAGAPTATTATVTTGGNGALLRSGWTLVSSLADVIGDSTAPYGSNARKTYATDASSWWMISAFNTTLNTGNSCYTNNTGGTVAESATVGSTIKCDDSDDAFKLNWLRTTVVTPPPGVPEPGSMALVALALFGATVARKRAVGRA